MSPIRFLANTVLPAPTKVIFGWDRCDSVAADMGTFPSLARDIIDGDVGRRGRPTERHHTPGRTRRTLALLDAGLVSGVLSRHQRSVEVTRARSGMAGFPASGGQSSEVLGVGTRRVRLTTRFLIMRSRAGGALL